VFHRTAGYLLWRWGRLVWAWELAQVFAAADFAQEGHAVAEFVETGQGL